VKGLQETRPKGDGIGLVRGSAPRTTDAPRGSGEQGGGHEPSRDDASGDGCHDHDGRQGSEVHDGATTPASVETNEEHAHDTPEDPRHDVGEDAPPSTRSPPCAWDSHIVSMSARRSGGKRKAARRVGTDDDPRDRR
jgi:hypothetical protein